VTLAQTPQTERISDPAVLLRYISAIRHSDAPGALKLADGASATTEGSLADRWRLQLLDAELNLDTLGGPNKKLITAILDRLKLPVPSDVPSAEAAARIASVKGYVAQTEYRWDDAAKLYEKAAAGIPVLNDDPCWKAELLVHHQAQTLRHLTKWSDVTSLLKRAAEESDSCLDKYWKTLAPNIQGNAFNDRFQYDRAVAQFRGCFVLAKANKFVQLVAICAANAALAYYNLGDYGNSLQMSDQADKYYALIRPLTNKQRSAWGVTQGHRARTYLAVDQLDEAARLYKEAMLSAVETNDRDYQIRWRDELASVYIEKSDLKTAEDLNKQVLNEANSGEIAVIADARLNAARLARLKGDFQQALKELALLQQDSQRKPSMALKLIWNMHTERAETFAALDRVPQARHEFDAALRTADSVYLDLGKDYDRLTYVSQLRSVYQSYVAFLIDRKLTGEALSVAESSHARLLAEKLNDTKTKSPSANFAGIARSRNAVILSYFTAPGRSYMWVTTAARSEVFDLPSEKDLRRLVKRHNEPILEERSIAEDQAGRELYERLIAPAVNLIPAKANVVVIPDGPLCDLNFETLIPPGPEPHYWIEYATVTISPSLRLLTAEQPRAIDPRSVLAIGSAVQVDAGLPPIGDNELRTIKEIYGAKCDLLSGTHATPVGFTNARPEHYSLIHFSAHAIQYPESPLDSYIALSPDTDSGYRLYAYELARIHLTADLVTLSACQSAGARNVPGEGLVGLTWAVLGAGAHNVIASLWPVAAPATAGLMNRFYIHLHAGESPDRALRAAKLELIAKLRATPYEWAAFQLYSR
jgi:CHAT domain-containing protein